MNNLFKKIAATFVGMAMAIGVGVAIGKGSVKEVRATGENGSYVFTFDQNSSKDGTGTSATGDASTALTTSNFATYGTYSYSNSGTRYWLFEGSENIESVESVENCYPGKESSLKVGKAAGDGSFSITLKGEEGFYIENVVVTAYGSADQVKITISEANEATQQQVITTSSAEYTFTYEEHVNTLSLTAGLGLTNKNKVANITRIVVNYAYPGEGGGEPEEPEEPEEKVPEDLLVEYSGDDELEVGDKLDLEELEVFLIYSDDSINEITEGYEAFLKDENDVETAFDLTTAFAEEGLYTIVIKYTPEGGETLKDEFMVLVEAEDEPEEPEEPEDTHGLSQDDPLTPAEAIALCDKAGSGNIVGKDKQYYVKGIFDEGTTVNTQYHQWYGMLSGTEFKVSGATNDSGVTVTEKDGEMDGKEVIVKGFIELYNNEYKVGYLPANASPTGAKFIPSIVWIKVSETPVDPEPEKVTVTFDSDGGSAVQAQEIDKGAKAAEPADPTKEGYEFKGWFLGNAETEFDFNTAINENITLKAKWEKVETPVDPEPEDTHGLSQEDPLTPAEAIALCDKAGSGNIVGKDKQYYVKGIFDEGTTVNTQYHQWYGTLSGTQFKVSGATNDSNVTVKEENGGMDGKEVVVKGFIELFNEEYKVGYLPANASPTGSKFVPSIVSIKVEETPVDPEPEKVTVTFNSDGGSAVKAQEIDKGAKATKPADPTKEGYEFKGWFLGEATTEFDFNTAINENITLKAKWEKVEDTPVDPGTGTDAHGLSQDDPLTPAEAIALCDEAGSGKIVGTNKEYYVKGIFDEGTTVNAQYHQWYGTLSGTAFKVSGATNDSGVTVEEKDGGMDGKEVIVKGFIELYNEEYKVGYLPANASPTGSKYVPSILSVKDATPDTPDTPETPEKVTVTFDVNGGAQTIAAQEIDKGAKATKPADPTKEGYEFKGWFLGNAETPFDFNTAIDEDITLKAKWEKIEDTPDDPGTTPVDPGTDTPDTPDTPENPTPEKTVVKIEVTGFDKLNYTKGQELDLSGLKVYLVYSDGSLDEVDLSQVKVEGYDANKLGEQTITVSYGELSATFNIVVSDAMGCHGSIVAGSALISLTTLLGAGLLMFKKRKEN